MPDTNAESKMFAADATVVEAYGIVTAEVSGAVRREVPFQYTSLPVVVKLVAFVPPLATPSVPSEKLDGFVPEQVRKPPGQELEMTPVLLIVSEVPPTSAPAVPLSEMPVPEETDEVAMPKAEPAPTAEYSSTFPAEMGEDVARPEPVPPEGVLQVKTPPAVAWLKN